MWWSLGPDQEKEIKQSERISTCGSFPKWRWDAAGTQFYDITKFGPIKAYLFGCKLNC